MSGRRLGAALICHDWQVAASGRNGEPGVDQAAAAGIRRGLRMNTRQFDEAAAEGDDTEVKLTSALRSGGGLIAAGESVALRLVTRADPQIRRGKHRKKARHPR